MVRKQEVDSKTKVIQCRVSEDTFDKFEQIAIEKGISVSSLGRQKIREFLQHGDKYQKYAKFLFNLLSSDIFKRVKEYTPEQFTMLLEIEEVLEID